MAYNEQVQQDLIGLIVGMFDAAPGNAIFNDVAEAYQAGASYADIADTLAGTDEFKSLYPSYLTNAQFVARLVNNMLDGHVSDADQVQDVIDLFVVEMNAGATRAQVALAAADALRNVDPADPVFGQAAVAFNNKVDVATYYSIDAGQSGDDLAELQGVLAGVDHTDASVDAAKDAIDGTGTGGGEGGNIWLEIGRDNEVVGTAGDDRFIADVVQSQNGAHVNTLGSGDRLDGGAGTDTLQAQVVHGTNYGGTNTAISARTQNIENIELEARNSDLGNDQSTVFVNASEMHGIDRIGSEYSDANLVIQNLTTYDTTGANGRGADPRLPSDLTITMSHTGGRNSNWDESDLHVFFAQNNLRPDVDTDTSASQANYWLADQDSTNYGAEPLQNIDRDGILFTLNGQQHGIRPADEVLLDANTWEEFAEGLREELEAMVAAGNTDLAGISIIVDETNIRQTYTDKGVLITVNAITLVDSNGGVFSDLGFTIPQSITGEFNVYGRVSTLAPETSTSEIISTNIELEKVGRGTDGGELVIGGMDKGYNLNFYNGVQGIEQFNVTVIGGEELPNSLSALRSTNNQLQIVNIVSDAQGADSFAGLQIGNENSTGYGLKDVRVVNAQDFDGDLSISAEITTESLAKYADLFDATGDATEDNVYFDYNLTGEGDNALWLDVDMDLAAHDDFVLTVLTDGGDDTVIVRLDANGYTDNQYANQSGLDNVTIGTGAGDDVIWTPGSGDVAINAGAGNDTVYTDNVEDTAAWVTNAVDTNYFDLLGAGTGSNYFLFESTLTVTFSGASVNSAGGVTTGSAVRNDNGFEATVKILANGYVGNHTHINQAIKQAINEDPVLSKLLVASDGPGYSLVIDSLTDGEFGASDLAITVNGPTAAQITNLGAGALAQANQAYKEFMQDSTATLGNAASTASIIGSQVNAAGTAYQGINGSTLATAGQSTVGASEVQTVDFADYTVTAAGDFTVGGVTVSVAANDDAAAIATKVAAALNAATNLTAPATTEAVTATVTGSTVQIVFNAADGDVTPVVVVDGTAVFEVPVPATPEQQTLDFAGLTAAGIGNISVGGILVNVNPTQTADQIAAVVAARINAEKAMNAPLGTVSATASGAEVVVTFDQADGNVAPISVVAGSTNLSGAPGVAETQAWNAGGTQAAPVANAAVDTVEEGVNPVGGGTAMTGTDSISVTDNVINLGSGQDVVVLSTSAHANETIVWTGHNTGKNTIVNFTDDVNETGYDLIDFSAYLTTQTSASDSEASAQDVATTVQIGAGVVNANEVVLVDFGSVGAASGVTWGSLSAASLQAALNANNATWSRGVTSDLHNTNKAVIMVHNTANDGEYKIFDVEFTNAGAGLNSGFTVVDLVGVADFGGELVDISAANFA